MPEVPQSVDLALKAIRPTMNLRWNPKAVVLEKGSYTVLGKATPPAYDPRWELWDEDANGREYKILTLQEPDGGFRPIGQWLVEKMRFINPERWGGDPNKMLEALIDMEQERRQEILDDDFETLAEATASWGAWYVRPKSRVVNDAKAGEWSAPAETGVKEKAGENNFDTLAAGATPATPGSKILTP